MAHLNSIKPSGVGIFGLFCLLLLASCQLTDTREGTPAVLKVDSLSFSSQGLGAMRTEKITDIWVKIIREKGEEFVGVYELPAVVQVPEAKGAKVAMLPGIIGDGRSGNRILQTLYRGDTLQQIPGPAEVRQVKPEFGYDTRNLKIPNPFKEGFEGQKHPFETSANANFDLEIDSSEDLPQRQGRKFGRVTMPQGQEGFAEVVLADDFQLARNGQKAFLEMTYRSNLNLSVGLRLTADDGSQATFFDLVLFPNSQWTHINVDLTEEVNNLRPGTPLEVAFRAASDGQERHFFDLDNLRLILESP